MSKSKKSVERVKTAMIILLTISALLLGWQTRLFNDIVNIIPIFGSVAELMRGAAGTEISGGTQIMEASRPLCIVITNKEGERFGARYDTDARNAVYDRISSIMGEALGSAAAPSEISEDEWRGALGGLGVYFEYNVPVKLSILDGWLGAGRYETMEDTSIRRLVVAIGEDKSRFYYQNDENGLFYGADTASAAGKAQELEIYSGNGAFFAFETGTAGAENAPYMLITDERNHPDLKASAAGGAEELLELSLAALGHGNETHADFREGDALRWIGTKFNIAGDALGRVSYRNSEAPRQDEGRRDLTEGETIELARMMVADTIGSLCGTAEVFFDSIEYGARGSVSVIFAYFAAGGRVFLFEDGCAARITLASGVITEAELNYRSFSFDGEYTRLLPEIQALAAAGGEFALYYSDTGSERLQPFWS